MKLNGVKSKKNIKKYSLIILIGLVILLSSVAFYLEYSQKVVVESNNFYPKTTEKAVIVNKHKIRKIKGTKRYYVRFEYSDGYIQDKKVNSIEYKNAHVGDKQEVSRNNMLVITFKNNNGIHTLAKQTDNNGKAIKFQSYSLYQLKKLMK